MDSNLFREFQETLIKLRRDSIVLVKMQVIHIPKLYVGYADYMIFDTVKNNWCIYIDDVLVNDAWNPTINELKTFIENYNMGDILSFIEQYNNDIKNIYLNKNGILFFDKFKEILDKCKKADINLNILTYEIHYDNSAEVFMITNIDSDGYILTDKILKDFLSTINYAVIHNALNNANKKLLNVSKK